MKKKEEPGLMFPKPKKVKKKKAKNNKRLKERMKCEECGRYTYCQTNEIFRGKNRQISIEHGFQNKLCDTCHDGITHFRSEYWIKKDLEWKQKAQREYETTHTRQDWMQLIGRNYLG